MSFYVKSTPEVANYLKTFHESNCVFVVYTAGDNFQIIAKDLLDNVKNYCIPEYKLHPKHGLIPANSKLFNKDSNKEQEENKMQQETKKVFEVGDKCVIKNVNNELYVNEEATANFVDKEVTIMSKFTIPSNLEDSDIDMVSVMNENGQCACFREEMCYPAKTEKEKALEEMEHIICSVQYVPPSSSIEYELAAKLYEAGYRKVGE